MSEHKDRIAKKARQGKDDTAGACGLAGRGAGSSGVCMPHGALKIGGYVDCRPDELTGRPDMTRHQRKRLRRYFRGVCQSCNERPEAGKMLCERHRIMAQEAARRSYQRSKAMHLKKYGMSRHRLEWIRARRPEVQARLVVG